MSKKIYLLFIWASNALPKMQKKSNIKNSNIDVTQDFKYDIFNKNLSV